MCSGTVRHTRTPRAGAACTQLAMGSQLYTQSCYILHCITAATKAWPGIAEEPQGTPSRGNMQQGVAAPSACGTCSSTRLVCRLPLPPLLWATQASPAHASRKVASAPSRTTCKAVKATDIQNYDDLATGWKVNPEKRLSQEINPRELVSECQTWQACQALLNENPDRFERNKNLGYVLLLRLADILGPPEGTTPETSITRFLTLPPARASASFEDANQDGGFSDPFADMLQKQLAREGAGQVSGAERQAALKVVDQTLRLIMGNLEKMKPDNVCGVLFVMCRLGHAPPTYLKTTLLCIKGFPKKFSVAQLCAVLAASTALNFKMPAAWLQAIVSQAQRGMRHATAADMNNAAYALHVYSRGSIETRQVNSIMRAARPWLFDMTGDALAFLAAMLARQGYKPPPGFIAGLMEALGPHWERISDPNTVVAVLLGFSGLKCELHQGVTDVMERVMCGGGMKLLSAEQLGVLGMVLANCAPAGYAPSQQLRALYVTQVQSRLAEVDETTAGVLLSGLAYMSVRPAVAADPSAAPAPPSSFLSARLAKLKAKKANSGSPASVPQHMIEELLEIVEAAVPKMGGHSLRQLAGSLAKLGVNNLGPALVDAYRYAVGAPVGKTHTYAGLTALAYAAGGCGVPALALPTSNQSAEAEVDGTLSSTAFAKAVAAQALKISQGPPQPAPSTQAAASDATSDGALEEAEVTEEIDRTQFLPSQQERQQLVDALAQLPQVHTAELELPEAKAPPPQLNFSSGQQGGFGNRNRGGDMWNANIGSAAPPRRQRDFNDNNWGAPATSSSGWLEDDSALWGGYDDTSQGWDAALDNVSGGYMAPARCSRQQGNAYQGGYQGYDTDQPWQQTRRPARWAPAPQEFDDFNAGFDQDMGGYMSGGSNQGWLDSDDESAQGGFYADAPRRSPAKPRAQQPPQHAAGSNRQQQGYASDFTAGDDYSLDGPEPSKFGGLGNISEDGDDLWFGAAPASGSAIKSQPARKPQGGSFANLLDDFDLDDEPSSAGLGPGPQPKATGFNLFEDDDDLFLPSPAAMPPTQPAAGPIVDSTAVAAPPGDEEPKVKAGRGRPRKADSTQAAVVDATLVRSGRASSRRRAATTAAAPEQAAAEDSPKRRGKAAQ